MQLSFLNNFSGYAHWTLRFALASVFFVHGSGKLMNPDMAAVMGMPLAVWIILGIAELAITVCMVLGAFSKDIFTRIGGLLASVIMLGAIFMVHLPNGWNFQNNGFEFQLTLVLIGVYLLLKGNGVNSATSST